MELTDQQREAIRLAFERAAEALQKALEIIREVFQKIAQIVLDAFRRLYPLLHSTYVWAQRRQMYLNLKGLLPTPPDWLAARIARHCPERWLPPPNWQAIWQL